MGHNPNTALMGATGSNIKEITNRKGTVNAGLAVELKSDDSIAAGLSTGSLIGISAGKDLSFTDKTAIVRKGVRVPVLLKAAFNPVVGAAVYIEKATGLAAASDGGNTQLVNATYVKGRYADGAIAEDGSSVGAAEIDFPGGL